MVTENLKTGKKEFFGNLKNLGILALVVVGIIGVLSMNVNAYYIDRMVTGAPTGTCYCYNCSDCTNALNDNANCSSIVKLNQSITNHTKSCIFNPSNFNKKTFDCQGNKIDGNYSGSYGIYLNGKTGNIIKNCIITDFKYGIYLYSSSNNNILTNNTANSNNYGIYLDYSSNNNNLINNTANSNNYGILLYSSTNNIMKNNTMNNNTYNFGINSEKISDYYQDIDTSNLVDNKPIYYWTNEKNAPNGCKNTLISELNNTGFVALISCDNITVKNLNLTKNFNGILLVNTTNSKILNNTANSNDYGIYLDYSSGNILTNNTANSNNFGISLDFSSNNILTNNTVNLNTYAGIYLYSSSDNTINNNTISSNNNGVYIYRNSNFNKISNNKILNNTETGITTSNCDYFKGTKCYGGNSNNTIEGNEILNNSVGIFSRQSNSTINNNTVCGNTNLDFNSSAWQSIGDNNTCDNADGWHDTSVPNGGCKNSCAQPSINLSKTANVSSLPAGGGSVTYYYNVTNTGNVPLNNVNVDDNKCSPINCPGTTLAVGASIKCNCTTPITQTTTNIANVTASYMQTQVSASASATVNVSPCDIDISILNLTFNPKKPVNGFILNLNVSINSTITATTNVTLTIDGNLTENKTINLLLGINYAEFTVLAKSGVHNVSVHVVPFDCDNNLSNNEYNKTYNASTPILLVKRTIGNLTKANETFNITFSGTPTPPGNWTMENMTNITFNYSKSLLAYGAKKIGTGKVVMTYKGSVTVSNSYSDNGTFIVYTPSSASNERQSRNVTIKMMDNSNPVASGNCNNLSQCTFLYDNNNTETISLEFSVPPGTHILYYEINITTDINNFNYTIQSLNKSSNNAYLQNDWLTQWTPEIQSMAQNLTQNCSSDFEKVGKISRWVYENINYDINLAGVANNASWVFANRTGVCAHYTNLLISMCRSINISARGVYGDVYNSSSYLGGHAWAEVFMDGKWYAVDPTFNEIGFIDSGHLSAGYDLSTLKSSYFSASLYGLTYIGSNIYYPDLKVLNTANITSVSQIIDITPKWRVANVVGSTVTYEITGLFNNSRGQGYIIGNAYLWTVGGSTLLSDYTHQVYVGQNESNASWRFNIILPGLSSGSDYTLPLTISTDPTPVNSANFNALTAPTFEIYNAQVPATIQQGTTTLNVTVRNIGVRNGNTAVTFYIDNSLNATNNLNVAGISETNATQFILNTASLSQGIHTIKFAVGSDVFTKTITVGQLTCNISDNSPCPSNQFCNSSSQCQNLNCSANQTAYNHGCINCVPFDLDGNNVKDIFDVVAGLEHLSEGKNISNEGCTAKDGHEINLFDLLTLIDKIGTNQI